MVEMRPEGAAACMTLARQETLFSSGGALALHPLCAGGARTQLSGGAWVDLWRSWVTGSEQLFTTLARKAAWHGGRRVMYDRVVEVPRLDCDYGPGADLPSPALGEMLGVLNAWYATELTAPLETVGLCLYRDGSDSVAWHGDRVGSASHLDTIVAIVSLGAARRFLLRPRGGGPAVRYELFSGDLLVMGGSCQRTWEHAVPKSRRPHGPRISVQFRARGVR